MIDGTIQGANTLRLETIKRFDSWQGKEESIGQIAPYQFKFNSFFYTPSLPYENIDWNKLIVIVDKILIDML